MQDNDESGLDPQCVERGKMENAQFWWYTIHTHARTLYTVLQFQDSRGKFGQSRCRWPTAPQL